MRNLLLPDCLNDIFVWGGSCDGNVQNKNKIVKSGIYLNNTGDNR